MSNFDFGVNDLGAIPNKIIISGVLNTGIKAKVSSRINTDIKNLSNQIERSPEELAGVLDVILREAISANIWSTRNGSQDIIDSGELLRSQEVIYSGSSIRIRYGVPYAALVHYGGYIIPYGNAGARPVYIPPRPWVYDVLNNQFNGFDLSGVYYDIVKRILSKF